MNDEDLKSIIKMAQEGLNSMGSVDSMMPQIAKMTSNMHKPNFIKCYLECNENTPVNVKVSLIEEYFNHANDDSTSWVAFMTKNGLRYFKGNIKDFEKILNE